MEGNYSISRNIQLESSLGVSVLSLGIHNVDSEVSNESSVKPLTVINGFELPFNLGIHYSVFRKLSVQFGYHFELIRISAWDDLLSAGDYATAGISYNF